MTDAPYRSGRDALLIDVRLTPRGGRDAIEGALALPDGRQVVRARVRAAPEDGRANAALEALMAEAFAVPRSQVSVVQGATARLKTVAIKGDPQGLSQAAARLFALALMAALCLGALSLGAASPAAAQFVVRGDICADRMEIVRSRVTVERAGLRASDRARLIRTLRAAESLAEEGCPRRDAWLVRRAVGMVNAVNREVRRPPVDLPLFLRD